MYTHMEMANGGRIYSVNKATRLKIRYKVAKVLLANAHIYLYTLNARKIEPLGVYHL